MGLIPGLTANLLIFAVLLYVALIHAYFPDLYYRSVQEDEYLEWATFWAFALATWGWFVAAQNQWRGTDRLPWFFACVGLFCLFVAGEEISWGQRLLGYRPPEYFLAQNFQQELNIHNVVDTDLRKLALQAVLASYGILLPILAWIPTTRRLFVRIGIFAPPLALLPSFAAALVMTTVYPWRFTNETVELMMGAGFLFAAIASMVPVFKEAAPPKVRKNTSLAILAGAVIVAGLGLVTAAATRYVRIHDPHTIELATVEIDALRRDFLAMAARPGQPFPNSRNTHKRIYTYVNRYRARYLSSGRFAGLVEGGLPEERAQFFLDPWNAPYWVKLRWNSKRTRRTAFVYSFGPNRRRDSGEMEIRGDDVGVFIFQDEPATRH